MEVRSSPVNIQDHHEVSDDELESARDSATTNPIAGPSTPPRNTSTTMPYASKLCKTARLYEVPETPKLANKSFPKRDRTQTQRYSKHGCERLVVGPTTHMQAMAYLDTDSSQSAILEEYQPI